MNNPKQHRTVEELERRRGKTGERHLGDAWQNWREGMSEREVTGSPALYSLLVVICYLLLCVCVAGIYYMMSPRLSAWNPSLATAAGATLLGIGVLVGVYILFELVSVWTGRELMPFVPFSYRRAFVITLFPLCRRIGKLLGKSEDAVSASLVNLNNRLIPRRAKRSAARRLLVILPRCLQNFYCQQDIIQDVSNCRSCGRCDVANLIGFMEKYRFHMAVATGGHLAIELVRDYNPSGIIAVACERELLRGLKDIAYIPVIGIANRRPEGPCKNTMIGIEEFEAALSSIFSATQN